MNVLGLLGGMSPESTVGYYRMADEEVRARRGGLHSAPLLLWSVDLAEIDELQVAGAWDEAGRLLAAAPVPVFRTTALHVRSAVDAAMGVTSA